MSEEKILTERDAACDLLGLPRPSPAPAGHPTFGERAVGLSFNPSGDPRVNACKRLFAMAIDQMHLLRSNPGASFEASRHASIAITEIESAQMRAVKALTFDA